MVVLAFICSALSELFNLIRKHLQRSNSMVVCSHQHSTLSEGRTVKEVELLFLLLSVYCVCEVAVFVGNNLTLTVMLKQNH